MLDELFADTSFWVAFILRRDPLYLRARTLLTQLGNRIKIVTSEFVLLEFLNHFSGYGELEREKAIAAWKDICNSPLIEVTPATTSLFARAATLYEKASDKQWSLTDCASFVIMRERKIMNALTFDHHFEQAGFKAMMRDGV
jgi:uncharacterized protein